MLAVPQLGFWLSLCVAVGASVIVPDRVTAHTDFSAGKTPEQLLSSDCSDCHRSAYGIAHSRSGPALTAFLREHYTTSFQAAGLLASYIVRARASHSAVHPTANQYLTIFWRKWRNVSMACRSFIERVRKLFHIW